MISSPTAIDELVAALIAGTRKGAIRWQTADSRGSAFIAKRKSGTVILQRGSALALPGTVRLTVKDRGGRTVEEVDSGSSGLSFALAGQSPAAAQLESLYESVRQQVTGADSTVRSLTKEFQQGE